MTKIEELKAAYAAATPGEWLSREGDTLNPERIYGVVKVLSPDQHGCDPSDGERTEVIVEVYPTAHDEGKVDAEFIALAHNMMPQLLEAVETLRAIRARYEGEFDNKALMDKGALLTDPCEDMYTFAKDYLEKLK